MEAGAGKNDTIVFVDDNKLVLQTVRHLLQNTSYELLPAATAFEGLCALADRKPAWVFIDADSARLDGYQFCQLVRRHPAYQGTRLFLVLDGMDAIEKAKARAAGAEGVLVKPFGQTELQALLTARQERAA